MSILSVQNQFDNPRCEIHVRWLDQQSDQFVSESFGMTPYQSTLTIALGPDQDDLVAFKVLSIDSVLMSKSSPTQKTKKFFSVAVGIDAGDSYHIVREELLLKEAK